MTTAICIRSYNTGRNFEPIFMKHMVGVGPLMDEPYCFWKQSPQ